MSGGTLFSSEYCPGGQYSRGDIIHSDTVKVLCSELGFYNMASKTVWALKVDELLWFVANTDT